MQQLFLFISRVFEKIFLQSWWVILFSILCYMLFEQGMKMRDQEYAKLQMQHIDLERQKKEALALQEKLTLEINSQSDPAWVEWVLIKGLGLVPEGQTKVFFDAAHAIPPAEYHAVRSQNP
jgi:hypothetical protein